MPAALHVLLIIPHVLLMITHVLLMITFTPVEGSGIMMAMGSVVGQVG